MVKPLLPLMSTIGFCWDKKWPRADKIWTPASLRTWFLTPAMEKLNVLFWFELYWRWRFRQKYKLLGYYGNLTVPEVVVYIGLQRNNGSIERSKRAQLNASAIMSFYNKWFKKVTIYLYPSIVMMVNYLIIFKRYFLYLWQSSIVTSFKDYLQPLFKK